jgi:hypothetical protein
MFSVDKFRRGFVLENGCIALALVLNILNIGCFLK